MSSQWGPKAAPVQHSAHILLGFILREPQSTTANFLDFVGEGRVAVRRRRCDLRRETRHGHLLEKVCKATPWV